MDRPLNVFIVEDEMLAIERLRLLLQEYDGSICIAGTADTIPAAVNWLNTHPVPDLVFLDIELADGMSFSIFSQTPIKCPVIFTTAYDQYAMEAFRLLSVDYLLKPVTLPALAGSIKKYNDLMSLGHQSVPYTLLAEQLKKSCKSYKQRFLVKVGTRMFFIANEEIAWFFADNKNVFLIDIEGNRYLIDYSLESLQEMMDPRCFFRLNRKFLCQVSAIKEIKNYFNNRLKIQLQAGPCKEEVVISRERVQPFKLWADV